MKDLVTGENNGKIRIYLNVGTDADPVFNGYSLLKVGGSTFDCGYYSWMHVADWNSDGLLDVICGGTDGKLRLIVNRGSPGSPLFYTWSFIKDGAVDLDVGSRSSPTVVDWNRDGKKDLLVGESSGKIRYFENKGTDETPDFNGYVILKADGKILDVGYDPHPDVVDWNNDGVMDIITGEFYGNVFIFEAIGPLSAGQTWLSEGSGGSVSFAINAGTANAGRQYLLLGSVSGTEPGTPLPGGQVTLPLNWDYFTNLTADFANTPLFDQFMGTLDGNGMAEAKLTLGPIPGAQGLYMNFAYTLNIPLDYVSNAPAVEIVP